MRTILFFTLGVSLTLLCPAAYAEQQSQAQQTQSTAQQGAKPQSVTQAQAEKGDRDCVAPKEPLDGSIPLVNLCNAKKVAAILNHLLLGDALKGITLVAAGDNNQLSFAGDLTGKEQLVKDLKKLLKLLDVPPKKDGGLVENLIYRLTKLKGNPPLVAKVVDKAVGGIKVNPLAGAGEDRVLNDILVLTPPKPIQTDSIAALRTALSQMEDECPDNCQAGSAWIKKFVIRLQNLKNGEEAAVALNRLIDDVEVKGARNAPFLIVAGTNVPGSFLQQLKKFVALLDRPAVAKKKDERKQSGTRVVQLFNLRKAPAIAEALKEAYKDVKVKSVGQDLLVIMGAESKNKKAVGDLRRRIADLDKPRPQVTIQAWGVQLSSKKPEDIDKWFRGVRNLVESYNSGMRDALRDGWEELICAVQGHAQVQCQIPLHAEHSRDHFFNEGFQDYISRKYVKDETNEGCGKSNRYCLGYTEAFVHSEPSLAKMLLFLAAAKDSGVAASTAQQMVQAMERAGSSYACTEGRQASEPEAPGRTKRMPRPTFRHFGEQLCQLITNKHHLLKAAILDFLFTYKWAIQYSHEFVSYDLQHSAHALDNLLTPVLDAFNRDIEIYVEGMQYGEKCSKKNGKACWPSPRTKKRRKAALTAGILPVKTGMELFSLGIIKVASLSGAKAKVEAKSVSYFDVTTQPSLSELISSQKEAQELLDPLLYVTRGPGQVVTALAALAAQKRTLAEVERGMKLTVTPTALATGSAVELDINLEIGVDDAAPTLVGKDGKKDAIARVAKHVVSDTVRVDALKLFEVSTFTSEVHHRRPDGIVPIVGHIWQGVFGAVPGAGRLFKWHRKPAAVKHRSLAIISAVVVPTAMDLALGIRFESDRKMVNGETYRLRSTNELPKQVRPFHKKKIECLLSFSPTDVWFLDGAQCANFTLASVPADHR